MFWVHRERSPCVCFQPPARRVFGPPSARSDQRSSSSFPAELLLRAPFLDVLAVNLSIAASPALGFVPSSRHHSSAATYVRGRSHAPLRSVPRFSQPLDGFFRARARGLVPSRCHVQGSLTVQGLLSLRSSPLPPRKQIPPCRCCIVAREPAPTFAGSCSVHVRCLSTSRPSSAPGRVPQVRLFTSPEAAPLIGFRAPPGPRSLDGRTARRDGFSSFEPTPSPLAATLRSCRFVLDLRFARFTLR
jgi:hypothetical protein